MDVVVGRASRTAPAGLSRARTRSRRQTRCRGKPGDPKGRASGTGPGGVGNQSQSSIQTLLFQTVKKVDLGGRPAPVVASLALAATAAASLIAAKKASAFRKSRRQSPKKAKSSSSGNGNGDDVGGENSKERVTLVDRVNTFFFGEFASASWLIILTALILSSVLSGSLLTDNLMYY
mmetsp:Transcript_14173/g.35848  ORF Transcript_14173/g.35848 Transcript_14173/m.35848 type:complete len:177 (-) Transcript_14173:236-766(-)